MMSADALIHILYAHIHIYLYIHIYSYIYIWAHLLWQSHIRHTYIYLYTHVHIYMWAHLLCTITDSTTCCLLVPLYTYNMYTPIYTYTPIYIVEPTCSVQSQIWKHDVCWCPYAHIICTHIYIPIHLCIQVSPPTLYNHGFENMMSAGAVYSRVSSNIFGDWNACGKVMGKL